jgi:hypothetical protein
MRTVNCILALSTVACAAPVKTLVPGRRLVSNGLVGPTGGRAGPISV